MKWNKSGSMLLLAALAVSACEEGLGPTDEFDVALDEDAALIAADAALEDLQSMFVPSVSPAIASYQTSGPTELSRTWTFYDAEGNQQDAYNPQTTESINIVTEMSGAIEREGWTAEVERSRDMTVSGLAGEETQRTWNGTASGMIAGSKHRDGDVARDYEMTTSALIEDVVVALPREQNPWPLSGTITRNVSATFTVGEETETRSRTTVLEFNGTQFATLTVGDKVFEVDLAARKSDRPVRKKDR